MEIAGYKAGVDCALSEFEKGRLRYDNRDNVVAALDRVKNNSYTKLNDHLRECDLELLEYWRKYAEDRQKFGVILKQLDKGMANNYSHGVLSGTEHIGRDIEMNLKYLFLNNRALHEDDPNGGYGYDEPGDVVVATQTLAKGLEVSLRGQKDIVGALNLASALLLSRSRENNISDDQLLSGVRRLFELYPDLKTKL